MHELVLGMARALPGVREVLSTDLAVRGLKRRRVLAAAVRMLDRGLLRIGSEQYAEDYGLATILREHVRVNVAA